MYRLANVNTTPLLRALGTLVTLSALVLLGDAGLAPTASAVDFFSGTADIKLVIYENKNMLFAFKTFDGIPPDFIISQKYYL